MRSLPRSLLLSVATLSVAAVCVAAPAVAQSISGSAKPLTNLPGDQLGPSIDGDIVVYTDASAGNDDVYYVDLAVNAGSVLVAGGSGDQRLHDVDANTIVYTDDIAAGGAQVFAYDVLLGTSQPLLVTLPGEQNDPTIDGNLVAFAAVDNTGSDIGLADLAAGTTVLVTSTPEVESSPELGGRFIVYERTPFYGSSAVSVVLYDIDAAFELTLGTGMDPHTDGVSVVYAEPTVLGDYDIVLYDIASGARIVLAEPGNQTGPHIDGDVVAYDDASTTFDLDVVVHHLPSGASTRVGNGGVEILNDIDGNRVVYTSTDSGNGLDIYVFEFSVNGVPPPPTTTDPCEDASGLTLLHSASFVRERGAPTQLSDTFTNTSGKSDAVVVVRNDRCASALVDLNGENVVRPDQLDSGATCGFGIVSLQASNTLDVEMRSAPGCELTVEVYAIDETVADGAGCSQSSAGGLLPFAWLGLALLGVRRRRS